MQESLQGQPQKQSMTGAYFDELYREKPDPYRLSTSFYEAWKYRDTLRTLPRRRYSTALEVGCSIGVFTRRLAARCDSLLSLDVSEAALQQARERCAKLPQVRFARIGIPQASPAGAVDLLMISEVAYFLTPEDTDRAARLLAARHLPGGHLVLVHFIPRVPEFPLTGDEAHALWRARPEWRLIREKRRKRYRIDVFERV